MTLPPRNSPRPRSPRSLDHLVLPVAGLDVARLRLTALGFTVAADARHPFGTENACVFFADKTYIEPLAVTSSAECAAAARAGNVFVAHDQAYRTHVGADGFSAIVVSTADAADDHERFRGTGLSAGEMLVFSRPMLLPDGRTATGGFRLAFAADPAAPYLLMFACERLQALPSDRAALETHENGVLGIADILLSSQNPAEARPFLAEVLDTDDAGQTSAGLEFNAGTARICVGDSDSLAAFLGIDTSGYGAALQARAIIFKVADLDATARHLTASTIAFITKDHRLIVPEAPGQGAVFVFGE